MSKLCQVVIFILSCFCLLRNYRSIITDLSSYRSIIMSGSAVVRDDSNTNKIASWINNNMSGVFIAERRNESASAAATGLLRALSSSSSSSSSSLSSTEAEEATAAGNSYNVSSAKEEEVTATTTDPLQPPPVDVVETSTVAAEKATAAGGNRRHNNVSSAAKEEEEEKVVTATTTTDPLPPPVVNVEVDPCRNKKLTTDEKLWIGMPAWNDKGLLHRALRSVEAQADTAGYAQIMVVVFEDYSERNMFTKGDKDKHGNTAGVQVVYLREQGEEKQQRGSAFAKDRLFDYIGSHALPHEYALFLDGDDTFPDGTTLQYIHNEMTTYKPWFAWGRHKGRFSKECGDVTPPTAWKDVRHAVWSFCHPRIFQSHLLRHLRDADLRRPDGSWLQKATDRGFVYKFMELAGPTRSRYVGKRRALYNYTFSNSNGLKRFPPKVIHGDKQYMIDSKPSPRGADHVHVVSCVSNHHHHGQNNTAAFLTALFRSKVPVRSTAGHPVQFHFHICHKPDRQDELQALAESLAVKFADNPSQHTITVHNITTYNSCGLARFMVAQTLMSQVYVDYVIMLNDDQYVFNTTLAQIYEQREPKTYKAWHVKHWMDTDRSSSSSSSTSRRRIAAASGAGRHDTATTKKNKKKDFWEPLVEQTSSTANPAANGQYLEQQQPAVERTWQYGDTGMSIIDANIFRIQQLFQDTTDSYMTFAEDIWLSYIVQRAGWKIKRLRVTFQQQQNHHDDDDPSSRRMKHAKNQAFEKVGYLGCSTSVP